MLLRFGGSGGELDGNGRATWPLIWTMPRPHRTGWDQMAACSRWARVWV